MEQKTTVSIFGACVSRDLFAMHDRKRMKYSNMYHLYHHFQLL